jgi:glycosyltransferase involved in cell wall biosynthesis
MFQGQGEIGELVKSCSVKILVVTIPNYNYTDALIRHLAARHKVVELRAGRYTWSGKLGLEFSQPSNPRRVDLVNSPNYPGADGDPIRQCRDARIEGLIRQAFAAVEPDLVHVHELQGFCASLVQIAYDLNIPIVQTVHNYWQICPQRDLFDYEGKWCTDYENGEKCRHCHRLPAAKDIVWLMKFKWSLYGTRWYRSIRQARLFFLAQQHRLLPKSVSSIASLSPFSADSYQERRAFMLSQMLLCDMIHAESSRSAAVLTYYGVPSSKIRVLNITSDTVDQCQPKASRMKSRPIVFGYRGALIETKGVEIVLKAFAQLDHSKVRMLIYGDGDLGYERRLRDLARGLQVEFRGRHSRDQISRVHEDIDVGLIPSLWEETFALVGTEYLNSGIPVIASRIGGMVDYVQDGTNGLLCPPGDVSAWVAAMRRFVETPDLIDRMRSTMGRWKSMEQFTEEIVSLYQQAVEMHPSNSE